MTQCAVYRRAICTYLSIYLSIYIYIYIYRLVFSTGPPVDVRYVHDCAMCTCLRVRYIHVQYVHDSSSRHCLPCYSHSPTHSHTHTCYAHRRNAVSARSRWAHSVACRIGGGRGRPRRLHSIWSTVVCVRALPLSSFTPHRGWI